MSNLFDESSLAMIPTAYKDGKLYSVRPVPEFGSEILTQPVDIDTDFNSNGGGVIVDANTFQTFGGGLDGIKRDGFVVGKQYRLEIQGTTTSSGFTLGNGSGSGNEYGAGFGVHYFTAINQRLWIRQTTAGTTDITTFSIKEVSNIGDFTFTRGSNLSATRVNASQLIEKGRENILLQSNQFDTTWGAVNLTPTSGQTGYDGSSDAWLVDISGGVNSQHIRQSVTASGVTSYSIYAKANTLDWILLYVGASQNTRGYFDIANGVLGGSNNLIDSKIESVGNGYYRCTIVCSDSITQVRLFLASADGSITQSSGSVYIQDAQLEIGLAATEVIESGATTGKAGILENTPRLDYSGGASCPSLLLEPSRTNLLNESEYFETYYTKQGVSITTNVSTSPEGLQNASKLVPDNGTGGNRSLGKSLTGLSGIHTFSTFAKAGEYGYVSLRMRNTPNAFVMFNLNNGSIHNIVDNAQYVTNSAKIEDYGNGWYRCSASFDPSGSGSVGDLFLSLSVGITGDETNQWNGDGVSGIYIWGMQFESGSYPTSYIPTYGVSQTRAFDVCGGAGDTATFNDSEGVLYAEFNPFFPAGSRQITISDGTYDNRIIIEVRENATKIKGLISASGLNSFDVAKNISVVDAYYKVALKYSATDCSFFVNGEKVSSLTGTIVMPTGLEFLSFSGRNDTSLLFTSKTKQVLTFPTALSDVECIALTTI